MALIKCSKCWHDVSDKVVVCPNCGARVTQAKARWRKPGPLEIAGALIVGAAMIWLVVQMKASKDAASIPASADMQGPVQVSAACEARASFAKVVARDRDAGISKSQTIAKLDNVQDSSSKQESLSVVDELYADAQMTPDTAYDRFKDLCQMMQNFGK